MIIMSAISAMVFNVANKTVKETVTQYRREQAALLAKGYTEFAIMAVMGNDRNANCLNEINGTALGSDPSIGDGYSVEVKLSYIIGANLPAAGCDRVLGSVVTPETPLQILVDVYIRYLDTDTTGMRTYHRRTLQRL